MATTGGVVGRESTAAGWVTMFLGSRPGEVTVALGASVDFGIGRALLKDSEGLGAVDEDGMDDAAVWGVVSGGSWLGSLGLCWENRRWRILGDGVKLLA